MRHTSVCCRVTAHRAMLGLLLSALAAPSTASSQVVTPRTTPSEPTLEQPSCFRGRPLPRCGNFWLTEFGVATVVSNNPNGLSGGLFTWEVGRMRNVGSRYALGIAAFGELGTPSSGIGVRPRLRVWLGGNTSIDIAPGAVVVGSNTGPAFTGHVALNLADYAALTVHLLGVRDAQYAIGPNSQLRRTGTSTHAIIFAGGRLGSLPGAIGGILFPVAAFALFYIACNGGGCD